jgi:multiple sugar transport system substrate-binding protein
LEQGFVQARGLDPESPPKNIDEIYQYAKKIHALGDDISGYYFAGSCSG